MGWGAVTSGWTQERVDLMAKLWKDGLSASDVASRLGGVTRSAVIGKVHRLGLSGRTKRMGRAAAINQHRRNAWKTKPTAKFPRPAIKIVAEPWVPIAEPFVPVEERKSLLNLQDEDCRWPFGDGPFSFCACAKEPGLPYCRPHAQIAFAPPNQGTPRAHLKRYHCGILAADPLAKIYPVDIREMEVAE